MTKDNIAQQTHDALHHIPRMPDHSEAARLNNRGGQQNRPRTNKPLQTARAASPSRGPRILVSWQRKIAAFFGTEHQ